MTLIDGDRIVTAQLYDDEHEEFTEKKMSIIDYVNAYTDEGVTKADVVEQTSKLAEEINERLINEYISKVECCDECFASVYCTLNKLRESRVPQDYCVENIKRCFDDQTIVT